MILSEDDYFALLLVNSPFLKRIHQVDESVVAVLLVLEGVEHDQPKSVLISDRTVGD
jgi:hypothetical protein